jgi:hypothetical protein
MVAFKNCTAQIIKLVLADLTFIPLAVGLLGMYPTFVYLFSVTIGTANPIWPTKLTNNFKAFFIINQVGELNVEHKPILPNAYHFQQPP